MSSRDYDIGNCGAMEQSDGSYVDSDGCITWYNKQGKWHCDHGPAVIYPDGDVSWYLNDVYYQFAKWCTLVSITDEDAMMLRLQYG
jgi:hypothetical protein